MRKFGRPESERHGPLVSALVVSAFFALGLPVTVAAEEQQVNAEPTPVTSGTEVTKGPTRSSTPPQQEAAGMRVHIDPETGEIGAPPPEALPTELPSAALSTSSTRALSDGLMETPSSVPGGGITVELRGRFQSPLVVTRDGEGKLSIQHGHLRHETKQGK